jgi:transcriptional regulator with XRE-family HTH domain
MATILRFPKRHHGRASAGAPRACKSAKAETVIPDRFRSAAARSSAAQYLDGIDPRDFQLLTAGTPTPQSRATSVVSPNSVMISTMPMALTDTSRGVKLSSLHTPEQDIDAHPCFTICVEKPFADIGFRLLLVRTALGKSQKQIGEAVGSSESGWSQFESGERRITLDPALQLFRKFGFSLDWVYENQAHHLGLDDRVRIEEARKKLAEEAAAKALSTAKAKKTSQRVKRRA